MSAAQFLLTLQLSRPTFLQDFTDAEQALVSAHFEYWKARLDEGRLILAGRTQTDFPTGLVVFEASDLEHATQLVQADPAVAGGVFVTKVEPYRTALLRGVGVIPRT